MRKLFSFLVALLTFVSVHAAVTPPTFSTEENPVWYHIQFKTGGNILNAPEAEANLKTIAVGNHGVASEWQLVGSVSEGYLK